MISFNEPEFEGYIAEWAEILLTAPKVTTVYYVGVTLWLPSAGTGLQVIPNFIVRTDDEYWETVSGLPHGRANHMLVTQVDQKELQEFYGRWSAKGWSPMPTTSLGIPDFTEPHEHIRIIEVPAGSSWSGPEFLSRIKDGLSVGHTHQEALRRYDSATRKLEEPRHYWACDERSSHVG